MAGAAIGGSRAAGAAPCPHSARFVDHSRHRWQSHLGCAPGGTGDGARGRTLLVRRRLRALPPAALAESADVTASATNSPAYCTTDLSVDWLAYASSTRIAMVCSPGPESTVRS